ncbi:MAG: EamA/RhaT family transporter [Bacteroidetes bacterium]|nr:EamA/RhaT family transporter [Bacteroidota bacterium]
MIYLLASIVLNSYLTLSFKVLQRLHINTLQAIVFNYVACVATGSVFNGAYPVNSTNIGAPWMIWAVVMGAMFISIFNVIGATAQKIGVAVASVANKLSLVIPFIFSLYLYHETNTFLKTTGIIVALTAVVFTCLPAEKNNNSVTGNSRQLLLLLPVVLFISSGLLDTLIVYVKNIFFNNPADNFNDFLITAFSVAACIGLLLMGIQLITGKQQFSMKALLAGIIIGIPNYFSIWALGKVISLYHGNSSAIIPVNNMGVVLFSAVMAWILFREKLSLINWLGIGLAIAAIALIAYG